MAKISPKDNFLKLAGGGRPEYVPFYTMTGTEGYIEAACCKRSGPSLFKDTRMGQPNGGKDMWGVTYVSTNETANASLPEPNNFLIKDITKWHETVKKPELTADRFDWEAMAKADIERANIDRSQSALIAGSFYQPFQELMAFLGHTDGLCAMHEEPEAVVELEEFMADCVEPYAAKILDYYKPDIWAIGDDTCSEYAPFFSVEMYRKFFKPIYTRFAKEAMNRGIPIIFHICGKIEPFVSEMLDFGVKYIEPTQESNDIVALIEKYKGQVSFIGGFDYGKHEPKGYPDYSEEAVREDVRATIDKYSPNGAWGMFAWPISYLGDPNIDKVKQIIWDETYYYGKKVYGYPV